MPRYVVLYRFTAEGAKNIRDTVQRARQTREQTEKRGFKVQTLLWTQGPYAPEGQSNQPVSPEMRAKIRQKHAWHTIYEQP